MIVKLIPIHNAQGVAESFDDSSLPLVLVVRQEGVGEPVVIEQHVCATWGAATETANTLAATMHPTYHKMYAFSLVATEYAP